MNKFRITFDMGDGNHKSYNVSDIPMYRGILDSNVFRPIAITVECLTSKTSYDASLLNANNFHDLKYTY